MTKFTTLASSILKKHTVREKCLGVLQEYVFDSNLLMAVKSLCSCSDVCVPANATPLHSLHKFDKRSQPSQRRCQGVASDGKQKQRDWYTSL